MPTYDTYDPQISGVVRRYAVIAEDVVVVVVENMHPWNTIKYVYITLPNLPESTIVITASDILKATVYDFPLREGRMPVLVPGNRVASPIESAPNSPTTPNSPITPIFAPMYSQSVLMEDRRGTAAPEVGSLVAAIRKGLSWNPIGSNSALSRILPARSESDEHAGGRKFWCM